MGYDIFRGTTKVNDSPSKIEACGIAKSASRLDPSSEYSVEKDGVIEARYRTHRRGSEPKAWVR